MKDRWREAFGHWTGRLSAFLLLLWTALGIISTLDTAKNLASPQHWVWQLVVSAGVRYVLLALVILLFYFALLEAQRRRLGQGIGDPPVAQPTEGVTLGSRDLTIHQALWVPAKHTDVTDLLRGRALEGRIDLRADCSELGRDPLKGELKQLVVTYSVGNGPVRTMVVLENERLRIPERR
jgi:hypothetical protein